MSELNDNLSAYDYAKAKLVEDVARYRDEEVAAFYGVFSAKADDPVSDLVVKSREPSRMHTKSAQSDPKRKANT